MSYLAYFRGIGIGLLMAAGSLVAIKPAPTLHINAADLVKTDGSVVKRSYPYSLLEKLPLINFDGEDDVVLHHSVDRVRLSTGEPGVEVVVLKKRPKRTLYAI